MSVQLSGSRDVIRQYSCYPGYGTRMRDKEGCLCSSFFFKFSGFMLSSTMLGLGMMKLGIGGVLIPKARSWLLGLY